MRSTAGRQAFSGTSAKLNARSLHDPDQVRRHFFAGFKQDGVLEFGQDHQPGIRQRIGDQSIEAGIAATVVLASQHQ
jgi:hypothetical protein